MHEITYRTHDFLSVLSDFESLDQSAVEANTWLGFDVAERVFGISPLLTVEEMSSVGEPDSLSMVMYLSQFYQLLKDMPPPAGERQEETLWPKKQPQITKQMTTQTLKKKKWEPCPQSAGPKVPNPPHDPDMVCEPRQPNNVQNL